MQKRLTRFKDCQDFFGSWQQRWSQATKKSGLQSYLDQLGFNLVGYGCTTVLEIQAISDRKWLRRLRIQTCWLVLFIQDRNFEGRINPLVKANFPASPPLVVAYALLEMPILDLTRAIGL